MTLRRPASLEPCVLAAVEVVDICLDGDPSDPYLVIELRTADRPEALYGLRARVSEYRPQENDPESCAGYIHDEVIEAVDAAPALPEPSGPVTWVELKASYVFDVLRALRVA